eukprot:15349692-Ditylum_brightwellii.AAC.1
MMFKQIPKHLAIKWAFHTLMAHTYVNTMIQVALALRASPHRTDQMYLLLKDGAGLGLYN